MGKISLLSLLLIVLSFGLYGQDKVIKGQVIGKEDAVGIPFVNVFGKGTTVGTTSDFDGNYEITLPQSVDTLVFSFIGYQTREVAIGSQSIIEVEMAEDVKTLEEVVVIGYGTIKKEDLTSNVAQIELDEIYNNNSPSFESALQGRASGLQIENVSGKLGEGVNVRVRGTSSLSSTNQPLYVIDGIPITSESQGGSFNQANNPLADINMADIETIDVLKDASAAAIYGSRAANGVILITTKKGKEGKAQFHVDYQFGLSQVPRKLDLMNGDQFRNLFFENTLRQGLPDPNVLNEISDANLTRWRNEGEITLSDGTKIGVSGGVLDQLDANTDWQDEIFRLGASHQFNVGIKGGSLSSKYYVGLSYTDQSGILIGNEYQRLGARLNGSHNFSDKFKVNVGISLSSVTNDRLNEDGDLGSPLQAIALPSADRLTASNELEVFSQLYTPFQELANATNRTETLRGLGNVGFELEITNGLKWNTDFGVDYLDQTDGKFQGPGTQDGGSLGLSKLNIATVVNSTVESYATYDHILDDHLLTFVAGAAYQGSFSEVESRQASGLSLDRTESDVAPELTFPRFAFLSYFARINYSYNHKYLLQISGRVDGSSKFGDNNRTGFFQAVSAGWNLHREEFLEGSKVEELKLKASYGVVGNAPAEDFLYLDTWSRVLYGENNGVSINNLRNPDLKWETTKQLDVGVEFSFGEGVVSGSVDYYDKRTSDLLFPVPVTGLSGSAFVLQNAGELKNSGIEFSLNTVNVNSGSFKWTTSFNITLPQNEILEIEGDTLISGSAAIIEGQSLGVIYLPQYLGVNPDNGQAIYAKNDGTETEDYEDADPTVVGDPNPDIFGGLGNRFEFGNFYFDTFVQFNIGNDILNQTGEFISNSGFNLINQTSDQVNRWYKPGDIADNPVHSPSQLDTELSSRWVEDGSFVRVKSLTFGFDVPHEKVKSWSLDYMKLYLGVQNAFTFTKYSGYDPEVGYVVPEASQIDSNINQGVDNFTTPQPRVFMAGIKVGF